MAATEVKAKKIIYLAGGCFWGMEEFFRQIPGVVEAVVGYANSAVENPTYEQVCADRTAAAETVALYYNPEQVDLLHLLNYFFSVIDPTSVDRQGGDEGRQYRSGIYFTEATDVPIIEAAVAEVQSRYGSNKIMTEVKPLINFYEAETYHQQYLQKNPKGYCHINMDLLELLRIKN